MVGVFQSKRLLAPTVQQSGKRKRGRNTMKKLTTLVFAALIAVTLSMPAWSQATTGSNTQTKTAPAKQDSKQNKKEAKAKKQAKKKADKDTKKDAKKK